MIGGRVLDTSAVLDLATGHSEYGQALLALANEVGIPLAVPAVTLMAAWAGSSTAAAPWLELLTTPEAAPTVVLVDLPTGQAIDAGRMAAASGHPSSPLGTVHAAHVALERGWPVVTRDPGALLALSTELRTETIP